MADGHCFISYSTADALDFARKLTNKLEGGTPNIPVWFDKDDLKPSGDWDIQIDHALKTCRMVLFVMTKDSTHEKSVCRQEWSRALSFKKPIVPLWLHNDIDVPFRLQDRQRVDFRGDFDKGLAQLRDYLAWLDSPEGVLQGYKDRLLDAERDLQRAGEADKLRIEADIEELKKQIETQQKVADNPKKAEEQTQKNIEAGLERERKPEKPLASYQSSKFINQPPGVAQNYFQDRLMETEQAILFLKNEAQRLLTVVGRGGAGKTAMVCRLLKFVENSALPDDFERKHGKMDVDGIVYLSETGSRKVNFANLFEDLCKLLPTASAEKLFALYKEPQTSTESKTLQLLAAFHGLKQVIVMLDNFENVVDDEGRNIKDAELNEALHAFLHTPHHPVKIIITTRVTARELDEFEPARQRLLHLDTGLQPKYAKEAMRLMDEGNLVGIQKADEALLDHAVERTRGLPRALEAIYMALRNDRYTKLEELIALPILPEKIVEAYVGEAFNRLDTNAQKVMQALAVYNRPVTPAAVDYLLAHHIPAMDSAPILQRLANMHFARKESGRYYLHPVDREFAFGLIGNGDLGVGKSDSSHSPIPNVLIPDSRFTQNGLTSRAADYFAQARKPSAEWKRLEDLSAQLAEFDLRYAAGDYDTAAYVLNEIDFDYMILWGYYRVVINYHERLQGKIIDRILANNSIGNLGSAYFSIGNIADALRYYNQVVMLARQSKDQEGEGRWLVGIGNCYATLGDLQKAIEYYEEAMHIAREIKDLENEGVTLTNLGALYLDLADFEKAIDANMKGLAIHRKIGIQRDEAVNLENIGNVFLSIEEYEKAKDNFQQAIQMADRISFIYVQLNARVGLTQAYLLQNDLVNARTTIEAALQYDVPENDHNATVAHGIIALRQGDEVTARGAFVHAIGQANEILSKTPEYYEALDAKGLALCGLAILDDDGGIGRLSALTNAVEMFRKARKIAPHAGIVKRNLRLFDELAKCDTEGILKDVRKAVEGKE